MLDLELTTYTIKVTLVLIKATQLITTQQYNNDVQLFGKKFQVPNINHNKY